MKKQCLLGLLLLFTACVFGQNEYYIAAPKWGLKPQSLTMNLPSPGDQGNYPFNGYDGRGSEHFATQNIQVDHNGRLLFFILGQNVFDRYGKHYATLNQVDLTQSSAMNEMKGMTSNMIVPVHGECHKYHIISTIDQGNNGTTSSARNFYYYSTIHVEYDEFGKLTTNSVPLIRHNPTDAADKTNAYPLQEINDEIENFFNEATTGITVTSMNAQGKRFLFVTNQGSVWRYTIDGINITNGTKIVEYASLFGSGSSQTNQYSRTEFEVITLPNGNFRLTQGLRHFGTTYARSLMFLDFDISGNLIQNSIKQYKYPNDFQKELKGIELTQNGKFAYVTHEVHNGSAIDRIEIEPAGGGVPVSQPLAFSGMNDFFMSAIELTLNHDMMLIGANRVALITNPESSSPGWVDNFLAITTNASNPFHPLSASPSALIYSLNGSLDSDNYGDHFKQAICCQDFSINELDGFILTSDQTWNDQANGGTPLDVDGDNVLHVRNELRIPRGRVLTVNNLRIEFDKNARLIIEEGGNNLSGGKLVLNNTTLTIDERCQEGDIWLGVEVRGNRSFPQGTVSLNSNLNNSQQGHLVMKNKSVIEHAEIGVLVSSRANAGNVYNSHFSMKTGGIVQALGNSEIRDCKRAVFADIYTIQNSLSYFDNCKITWTDSNHFKAQGLPVSSLVYLNGVRNYRFIGCQIENATTAINQREIGIGIWSNTSNFSVLGKPTCGQFPCNTYQFGQFLNLNKGIFVSNSVSSRQAFKVERQNFVNCSFGIESNNAINNQITLNNFFTRELKSIQTAGIVMRNNTGYKVEENFLTQNNDNAVAFADGRVYGIVVSNSGTADNQIYKNRFKDLYIGGQSELDNSPRVKNASGTWVSNTPNNNEGGLRWVCNTFDNTGSVLLHDLIVVNGDIALTQENIDQQATATDNDRRKRAANNSFSLIGEGIALEHDIKVDMNSAHMQYMHLANPNLTPDSRTTAGQNHVQPILVQNQTGSPLTSNGTECPSKINGTINDNVLRGRQMMDSLRFVNDGLSKLVDGGETSALVEQIKKAPVAGSLVASLLNKAPLSDTVLIEFIKRNPPASAVKTILLASSGLTDQVYAEYAKLNLPIGVKNEIDMAQNLISERAKVERQYYHNQVKMQEIFNDILRQQWFDSTVNQPYQQVLNTLVAYSDLFQNEELLALTANLYATLGNTSGELDQLVQQLMSSQISTNYKDLFMLDIATEGTESSAVLVLQQPENVTLVSTLANLSDLASETQLEASAILGAKSYANAYLNLNKEGENPIILEPSIQKSKLTINGPVNESKDNSRFAMIYPNPSSGIVNIDFTEHMDGEMKIEVIDVQGKVQHLSTRAQANAEQMDFTHLEKGIYLIRVTIAQEVVGIERWIKQ